MTRPRILLADDHRMVAEGLKALLAVDFELVGIVEDGRALIEAVRTLQPDVVVTDLTMPNLNGLEAIARLRAEQSSLRIVVLTMHRDLAYARRALALGAMGYVLKQDAPEELVRAIRAALAGKIFVTQEVESELLQAAVRAPSAIDDPVARLTPRQREILQLLAEGRTAKEIGAQLGISTRTVETHKYELMASAGLHSSAELVHFAIRHGIVAI